MSCVYFAMHLRLRLPTMSVICCSLKNVTDVNKPKFKKYIEKTDSKLSFYKILLNYTCSNKIFIFFATLNGISVSVKISKLSGAAKHLSPELFFHDLPERLLYFRKLMDKIKTH